MVNDLEHAWLAVDRQAIEAARRSGRAKRQRRRPAAPAAELHPDEPPSPWRLLIIGPVSREAGSRPSHLFPRRFRSLSARIGAEDRKSVVSGKSVSVRVDLGGRRIIKKKYEKLEDINEKN